MSKGILKHHSEDLVYHKSNWPRRELGERWRLDWPFFKSIG